MVKKATIKDFKQFERMARGFYSEAGYKDLYGAEIDEDSLISFLVSFLTDENKITLIDDEKGMICGVLTPWFFNNSFQMAQEMAWWVDPKYRKTSTAGRLFKAFENWAVENNAKIFVMASLPFLGGERINKFYERHGMKNTENYYGKTL